MLNSPKSVVVQNQERRVYRVDRRCTILCRSFDPRITAVTYYTLMLDPFCFVDVRARTGPRRGTCLTRNTLHVNLCVSNTYCILSISDDGEDD